jgi:hypothetical protein
MKKRKKPPTTREIAEPLRAIRTLRRSWKGKKE